LIWQVFLGRSKAPSSVISYDKSLAGNAILSKKTSYILPFLNCFLKEKLDLSTQKALKSLCFGKLK